MTARRIGITPGSGDYVGAADTDADDASGNTITAQLFLLMNERGEIVDVPKMYDKMMSTQQEMLDVLKQILEVLEQDNG